MNLGNLFRSGIAASMLFACAAHAAPFYYFGNAPGTGGAFPQGCSDSVINCAPITAEALFNSQVAVTLTESFESSAPGPISANNTLSVLVSNTLTQSPPSSNLLGGAVISGTTFSGRFNTTLGAASGKWFETDSGFAISLDTAVGAFGFYGTDFGDFAGSLEIELRKGDTQVYANVFTAVGGGALPIGTASDGSLLFFGFASDLAFDQIVFKLGQGTTSGDEDFLGFDDIMIGNLRAVTPPPPPNPVPEPGSLALVGLALFAAGWARKTQRRT